MKVKSIKSRNLALEGNPLTIDDLKKEIAKGEKGPFYSTEKAKKLMTEWRKKKGSR